jgi:hypothetical protein
MKARCFMLTIAIIALVISLGCAGKQDQTDSMLDMYWGSSFESAKYNQILNPDAGKNLDPVVGLDGEAAGKTMERYQEGFKEKSSTSVNLGIVSSGK